MPEFHDELLAVAAELDEAATPVDRANIKGSLDRLEAAAAEVAKAWSGSAIGHHAWIYYSGFKPPPPGAHFSPEWGLEQHMAIDGTTGEWIEHNPEDVERSIRSRAKNPNLDPARAVARQAKTLFESRRSDVLSIVTVVERGDSFLSSIHKDIDNLKVLSSDELLRAWRPRKWWSRDSLAMSKGLQDPPHLTVMAEAVALRQAPAACRLLAELARKAGAHLARLRRTEPSKERGTHVFVGHGQSLLWLELKEFLQDRLHLSVEEFNRISPAGVATAERLRSMLDASAFAFLIMTGEDEQPDGKLHARMNVVHEAGLFQGRLGFEKAIVLLEAGCEEFSNIHGIGHIRFPRGNISASFEAIRQVLERENVIERPSH